MAQQNIDIVRSGYEAFGRGDIDGLLALLDPDVVWTTPGPEDLPTAGRRRGLQAVGQFFQTLLGMCDMLRFEPTAFIADGDRVIVLGSDTARMKATGTTLELEWAHAFTVINGKVAAFTEYADMSEMVADIRRSAARV